MAIYAGVYVSFLRVELTLAKPDLWVGMNLDAFAQLAIPAMPNKLPRRALS